MGSQCSVLNASENRTETDVKFLIRQWVVLLIALIIGSPGPHPAFALGGLAQLLEGAAPEEPLEVQIGVEITQITSVDQKAENFGVVARIRMRWQDDNLAFDPAQTGGRAIKALSGSDFVNEARRVGGRLPVWTIENQQSRSFSKSGAVVWFPDGNAVYTEEVIVTLQAPDFDFRRFPFDHQSFYFRIVADAPVEFIRFLPLEEASGMGDTLGEEEWVVETSWTEVEEVRGLSSLPSSRYSLGFSAHRHQLYYWVRIFVPVILLTLIGWANLFLEEYRRRIDIATGNLLALIAFNFTIAGELPRLGYLTFLDSVMMSVFIISVASVVYNVGLRRISMSGREDKARAIDWHMTYWGYPAIFLVALVLLWNAHF